MAHPAGAGGPYQPVHGTTSSLQDFEVIKEIASGQFGTVYRVRRRQDNRIYALKALIIRDDKSLQAAIHETRLLMSFNHENLVSSYDCFVENSTFYVVMEHAPYKDLRYYINKAQRLSQPFPEVIIWKVLLQLARGLCEMHRMNVIHRDLKAENVVLFPGDVIKIADLGVARVMRDDECVTTCVGTLLTMSPQVLDKQPYNTKSDMWSLGCVMYEMLTLELPFGNGYAAVTRIMEGDFKPIPSGCYSPELVAFVNALLSVDPRLRPSAAQVIQTAPNEWWRSMPVGPNQHRPVSVSESGAGNGLMATIHIPEDWDLLPTVLPAARYPGPAAGHPAGAPAPRESRPAGLPRDRGHSECGNWGAGVPRPFRDDVTPHK